ncbi:sarcosine oxidase subunit gamma [Antrihabitans cavernicola]|uniref:Sarcosine oxidase subunit gamma n=1 Tax=Antrihabitans cavernicola TaxID=2495913 RepID=A0A5A7S776_9NOCA|nr:sarcosine oxidase subunit gamma family protein [Spelaeibacter cavernicola]KAA0020028.1 sarcosine oxidase subunit gamma [Spelaeibacter cavernicola]
MADLLTPTSPLQSFAAQFAALGPTTHVAEEPFAAMVVIRFDPSGPALDAVADVLAIAPPLQPSTCLHRDGVTVIWLGPDEWLVTSTSHDPVALEEQLREVLAPHDGSAVDVSGQRTTVRLSGPDAPRMLAGGCSIDLHPRAFGVNSAVQTTVGVVGVVLIALGGDDFRILVRSSFARHFAAWLLDVAVEYSDRTTP